LYVIMTRQMSFFDHYLMYYPNPLVTHYTVALFSRSKTTFCIKQLMTLRRCDIWILLGHRAKNESIK
jgi:hypothetical protein